MNEEEKTFRRWLSKQEVQYLRDLCGWLHRLPEIDLSLPELKAIVVDVLDIG